MDNQLSQSRRKFIRDAAAAAATPILFPMILSASPDIQKPPASERVNMALIGCGGMGNYNLKLFLRKPEVQVSAVCDPDKESRENTRHMVDQFYAKNSRTGKYQGCVAYNDFRDVITRKDIDAIIQATPDHWHGIIVIAAAKAGKDIYGEKPLSLTINQGRLMCDIVKNYGVVFQTGSQQRSDSRFRLACELVRNNRIGPVYKVEVGIPGGSVIGNQPAAPVPDGFDYNMWLGPAPYVPYCKHRTHFEFRNILDYSGGMITDWGAHHIDIAQWGLGTTETGPVHIQGNGQYPEDGLWNAAVTFNFTATYADGRQVVVSDSFPQGVKFIGEKGWVFVKRGFIDAEPKSLLKSVIKPQEIHLYPSDDHRQNFLDCIRSRGETAAPIEQAHRSITIAHLANIAMQLQRPIHWNPEKEEFVNDPEACRMSRRALREPWRL